MMSVPPTGLPFATLKPGQTRHLPTRVVSLSRPGMEGQVALPQKGEKLQIGDISQLNNDPRIQAALKRLAEDKAPETVAQLVMWKMVAGLDWEAIAQLSSRWANAHELALARQFVQQLDEPGDALPSEKPGSVNESGTLYFDVIAHNPEHKALATELRNLFADKIVLGLKAKSGVPDQPEGPAVACRVQLTGSGAKTVATVLVGINDAQGTSWVPMGKFTLPLTRREGGKLEATAMAQALGEGLMSRLVRAQLSKGPKVRVKVKDAEGKEKYTNIDTYQIRIDNASSMILNGLALTGLDKASAKQPSVLVGFSLSPRKSMTVPASAEVVDRLGLKGGVRIVAVDLSSL
jgi:hypothetical protein